MKLQDFDYRLWNKEAKTYLKQKVEFEKGKVSFIPENDDRIEIELWSGVCDKDGVKIFEGDIVKYKFGKSNLLVSYELFHWWLIDLNVEKDLRRDCAIELKNVRQRSYRSAIDESQIIYESPVLEVIGNIHENADLLQKEVGE